MPPGLQSRLRLEFGLYLRRLRALCKARAGQEFDNRPSEPACGGEQGPAPEPNGRGFSYESMTEEELNRYILLLSNLNNNSVSACFCSECRCMQRRRGFVHPSRLAQPASSCNKKQQKQARAAYCNLVWQNMCEEHILPKLGMALMGTATCHVLLT